MTSATRKLLLRRAALSLAVAIAGATAQPALASHSDLGGEWHLDSFGATTPDSSGHNLTGATVGSPQVVSPARFGNGLKFPTESDYINAGNHAELQPANVSVVAWVRSASVPATVKGVVSQGATGTCSHSSYSLYTGGSTDTSGLRFYIWNGTSAPRSAPAPNTMWDGQWHLAVGTYDGSAVRLYVDGQLIGSTPASGNIVYSLAGNNDLILGGAVDPSCIEQINWSGDLDEVRVYNRALSPEEITYLARSDHTTPPELPIPGTPPPPPRDTPVVVPDEVIKPPQMLVAARSGQTATLGCGGAQITNLVATSVTTQWFKLLPTRTSLRGAGTLNTLVGIPRIAKLVATTPTFKVSAKDAGDKIVCVQTGKTFNGKSLVTASPINIYSPVGGSKLYRVPSTYGDFRVRGIDVFQITQPSAGAQMFGFPSGAFGTTCGGGTPSGYVGPGCARSADPTRVAYDGVPLDMRKPTTAIVYVNMVRAPPASGTSLNVTLQARLNGKLLQGAVTQPFRPVVAPTPFVTADERGSAVLGVRFTVPPAWLLLASLSGEQLDLEAKAALPVSAGAGYETECGFLAVVAANDCTSTDDRFSLGDLPVSDRLSGIHIRPIPLLLAGQGGFPAPETVLSEVFRLYPGGDQMFIESYGAAVDISGVTRLTATSGCGTAPAGETPAAAGARVRSCRSSAVDAALDGWWRASAANRTGYNLLAAIHDYPAGDGGQEPGWTRAGPKLGTPGAHPTIAINDGSMNRPHTAAAHEFGHSLGIPHAGRDLGGIFGATACRGSSDGQVGEPWPPDFTGRLQGVLFEPATNTPTVDTDTSQRFDLMSYCAPESQSWLSPRNWNRAFSVISALDAASRSRTFARAAAGNGQAFVSGTWDVGTSEARIVRVYPADPGNLVDAPDPQSPVKVRSLDAAGKVLGEVGAVITLPIIHGLGRGGATFDAPLANGATAVELVMGGVVVDRTAASRPPTVRLTTPAAGTRARKGSLAVRWKTTDADSSDRQASVEYAADGRNFRTVWQGPDRGSATVPTAYLEGATRGRVRVTINDGFNEATATSGAIRVAGKPPVVRLQGPRPKARLYSDLPVVLLGSALDDTERPLAGSRLTWFAGARRLGHGNRLRVKLPAGRVLLRLVARDARGRTATATRRVTVGPPLLRVTSLDVPDKVAHGVRTVKARLTTSAPATVTSGGHRYALGTRRTTIKIALAGKPRAGVLTPRITLRGRAKGQKPLRVDLVVYRK